MARKRKQVASPSEVMMATAKLLTPQEGPVIKSTVVKYQNIRHGSKLHAEIRSYLRYLNIYHHARYSLQKQGLTLQNELDGALTHIIQRGQKEPLLSESKRWAFKLVNKVIGKRTLRDGTEQTYIAAADIYCVDTPDKDFTTKTAAYMPREQADALEFDFIDLGDANKPSEEPSEPPAEEPDATDDGTDDATETLTAEDLAAAIERMRVEYRNLKNMDERLSFFMDRVKEEDRPDFFLILRKGERRNLHNLLDANIQTQVAHTLDAPDSHIPSAIQTKLGR